MTRSLPSATFGRTGHTSSRLIFGGAALGAISAEKATAVLDDAYAAGINHFDTAAGYGDSELAMAPWLARHRDDVFLATKTGERTANGARAQLESSLERMGVDSVDLIQLHNLVEPDEWECAFDSGGALEALLQARDEGLVRYIGVTGHGTRIVERHLQSLERFDFDSVLFPLNPALWQLEFYRTTATKLLETCAERNVAVQTIKSLAKHRWEPDATGPRFSWYRPVDAPLVEAAVSFVLSFPTVFCNTSSDLRLLSPTIAATHACYQNQALPVGSAIDPLFALRDRAATTVLAGGVTPLFDGSDALERI